GGWVRAVSPSRRRKVAQTVHGTLEASRFQRPVFCSLRYSRNCAAVCSRAHTSLGVPYLKAWRIKKFIGQGERADMTKLARATRIASLAWRPPTSVQEDMTQQRMRICPLWYKAAGN